MAFDKSKPTNSEKIRELGEVIRPNWDAIETADETFKPQGLNFDDRTALGIADDPTAIADAVITYCKQDTSGDPQLYAINPSSVISQLTGSFSAAASGTTTVQGGIIVKWGTSNGNGAGIVNAFGAAFPNNCWSVVLTGQTSADNRNICRVTAKTVNNFTFKTYRGDTGTAGGAESAYYIAIGN